MVSGQQQKYMFKMALKSKMIKRSTYFESGGNGFKPFNLGVLQYRVSGNYAEHLQNLLHPALEGIKLPEKVRLAEVEVLL